MNEDPDYEAVRSACSDAVEQLKAAKPAVLSVSFDGGKTWHELNGRDFRIDALAEPFGEDHNHQLWVYASAALQGAFNLKPAKPRKVRQKPPFWSAYK